MEIKELVASFRRKYLIIAILIGFFVIGAVNSALRRHTDYVSTVRVTVRP